LEEVHHLDLDQAAVAAVGVAVAVAYIYLNCIINYLYTRKIVLY
jgi:hypothetical protein